MNGVDRRVERTAESCPESARGTTFSKALY